eukprot:2656377-Pyramimonas_sp.AAC.1
MSSAQPDQSWVVISQCWTSSTAAPGGPKAAAPAGAACAAGFLFLRRGGPGAPAATGWGVEPQ